MNYPSRNDETIDHPDWNQSPSSLTADLTTNEDLNGIANLRENHSDGGAIKVNATDLRPSTSGVGPGVPMSKDKRSGDTSASKAIATTRPWLSFSRLDSKRCHEWFIESATKAWKVVVKFARFIGPGFLIAVAYIDPGNYATDVAAGAVTEYSLLFIVLMSNCFAIFLQSLCIKLGSVTGRNLAEMCREHLPRWLTIILYAFSEAAIIATDIAEVIGSAIALNLLLNIPLVAGCAITLVDVLIILIFYNPSGSMNRLRVFEMFVAALVLGVVICFCIELAYIKNGSVGHVFKGYLPSSAVVDGNGIYLSCGILGATVMPHSIFLGSGIVQSRLREFDIQSGNTSLDLEPITSNDDLSKYRPSLAAIKSCLKYSILELATCLFTFALFVNSAILIVAGASLYNNSTAAGADLFGIYALLSSTLAPVAGTIFAIALLLSGTSAGIICTMAGQMVSEGMLNWSVAPWLRRLITRSISIIPSIIIAGAVGKEGLNQTLTASQVVLSVILPFVTAPLIYFTCREKFMTVHVYDSSQTNEEEETGRSVLYSVNMKNGWIVTLFAVLIWLVLVVMNIALLVLVGLGKA